MWGTGGSGSGGVWGGGEKMFDFCRWKWCVLVHFTHCLWPQKTQLWQTTNQKRTVNVLIYKTVLGHLYCRPPVQNIYGAVFVSPFSVVDAPIVEWVQADSTVPQPTKYYISHRAPGQTIIHTVFHFVWPHRPGNLPERPRLGGLVHEEAHPSFPYSDWSPLKALMLKAPTAC